MNNCSRLVAVLMASVFFSGATWALPREARVPGGVALITLGDAVADTTTPTAWLEEQPVMVVEENGKWIAVVGLALDLPAGPRVLTIDHAGIRKTLDFNVSAKHYPEQHIRLKDSGKVKLSSEDEARAIDEIAEIQRLKRHWRAATDTDSRLALPADGRLSSRFGLRRYFNGQARAPHSGLDIAVPRGTPIRASAHGLILAVEDYFFNGKTVFVDHGNGLISLYCHLDRIDVQAGDLVRDGQPLGASGMTGRASGPHLHWSVFLNGAAVDPTLFLKSGTGD